MKQLFLITWRWLKKDKKRTVLTLTSIMLSVFLISFVGVYFSAFINALHGDVEYQSPEHVTINTKNLEQAKTLDNNVAWESHCLEVERSCLALADFFGKYSHTHRNLFPTLSINGTDVFLNGQTDDISASAVSGDTDKLMPKATFQVEGKAPEKKGEVAISHAVSKNYGLEIGDTVTLRYEVREGQFYNADLDENNKAILDNNGNVIYKKDTDGSRLREIYSEVGEQIKHCAYDDYYSIFCRYYQTAEGEDPAGNRTTGVNGIKVAPGYAELSDEVIESYEYTATVTGLVKGGLYGKAADMVFYAYDEGIRPFIWTDSESFKYLVRVKESTDAEQAAIDASKSIGIWDPDNPPFKVNAELLVYEGRQLEYVVESAGIIVCYFLVVGLFMLLARLIINNAFEISAAYRTEQYGALKTIGASDRQIFAMIMIECAMYMAVALPLGMGLAALIGKAIIAKIRKIGVFDPIYGEGVSEMFFKMELSPFVMWLTFGCALFSVFFSAYADAMRVRRMPPIQSVGYSSSKRRIVLAANDRRKSRWVSRKLFGFPFGFAVKCISKQKVRFAVTLLAAVISGVFIMTLTCIAKNYADYELERSQLEDRSADFIVWSDGTETRKAVASKVGKMMSTGLFDGVFQIQDLNVTDTMGNVSPYLSEDYQSFKNRYSYDGDRTYMQIKSITRDQYERYIKCDVSYDSLLNSGKILLSDTVYAERYDDFEGGEAEEIREKYGITKTYISDYGYYLVLGISPYSREEEIKTLTFERMTGGEVVSDGFAAGGFYTTDEPEYMCNDTTYLTAIMPIEVFTGDLLAVNRDGSNQSSFNSGSNMGYYLYAKQGAEEKARSYIMSEFGIKSHDDYEDMTAETKLKENIVSAAKTAGFGLGITLAVVVLMNIFSTMSANMINRRRDFSMMRSCGMSLKQVKQTLIIESLFYAVITTLVSSAAGWVLSEVIMMFYSTRSVRVEDLSSFPWYASAVLFAVIMGVMAAAFMPSLSAMKKQHIADEIRTNL